MHKDIKDSIKARLYDVKYTPFLASYSFAWLFFNAKLFLIFFSSMKATEKIDTLSYNDIVYIKPLLFALLYTLIFPLATAGFYYVTLQYKRLMNYIQQKIQDVTPLPQEQANKIIRENSNLITEHDSAIKALNEAKERFEENEQKLIRENKEVKDLFETREKEIKQKLIDLESYKGLSDTQEKELKNLKVNYQELQQINEKNKKDLGFAYSQHKEYDTELIKRESANKKKLQKIKELEETIKTLKNKTEELTKSLNKDKKPILPSAKVPFRDNKELIDMLSTARARENDEIDTVINTLSEDEKKVLKTIYDKGMREANESTYINTIASNTKGFNQSQIRNILDDLIIKNCISINSIKYYDTTSKGRKVMARLFDKK